MSRRAMAANVATIVPNDRISNVARACPRLKVGQRYYVDGQPFIFDRFLEEGLLLFRCPPTLPPAFIRV